MATAASKLPSHVQPLALPLLSSAIRSSGRSRSTSIVTCASKGGKKKLYGTGRADLGLPSGPGGSSQPHAPEAPKPTLGDYLTFGKLIGERVQDVKRQLDINGQAVVVDKQSQELLQDWEAEQTAAYEMFEALVSREADIGEQASRTNSVLMKNKNKASDNIARISRFVQKEYLSDRPLTAAEKKLSKNRERAGLELNAAQAMELYGRSLGFCR